MYEIQQKRAKRSHDAAATPTTTTTTMATTMTHTNKQEAERQNKREWRKTSLPKKRYRTLHSIGSSSSDAGRGSRKRTEHSMQAEAETERERETESLAFTRFNAEFQLQECRKTTKKREWGKEKGRERVENE